MKKMNVTSSGLVPLSAEETLNTRGGIGIGAAILIGLAIAGGGEIISDWDNFKNGLFGRPRMQ